MKAIKILSFLLFMMHSFSCSKKSPTFSSFDENASLEKKFWLAYSKEKTTFKIWSPTATAVKLNFYKTGNNSEIFETHKLKVDKNGVWSKKIQGDLDGTYYTFQTFINDSWLAETPGIYAQAVGVNGNRAMVLDLARTNPLNWKNDTYVPLKSENDAVIY